MKKDHEPIQSSPSESQFILPNLRIDYARRQKLLVYHELVSGYLRQVVTATRALHALDQKLQRVYRNLGSEAQVIVNQLDVVKQSINCGETFLGLVDELSGVADQAEIERFFRFCLQVNMADSDFYMQTDRTLKLSSSQRFLTLTKQLAAATNREYGQYYPTWFKGSPLEWSTYAIQRCSMQWYDSDQRARKAYSRGAFDSFLVDRSIDLPDWLNKSPVEPDEVKAELEDDRIDLVRLREALRGINRQVKVGGSLITDKYLAFRNKILEKFTSFLPESTDFYVRIIALALYIEVMTKVNQSLTAFSRVRRENTPEQLAKLVIAAHIDSYSFLLGNKEVLSAWIAEQFRKNSMALENPVASEVLITLLSDDKISWQELRSKNRKLYFSFFYDLRPLISALSAEEKSYLLWLLQQGSSTEEVSQETAELAAAFYRRGKEVIDQFKHEQQIAVGHLGQFMLRWLPRVWEKIYRQISVELKTPPATVAESSQISEVTAALVPQVFVGDLADFQSSIAELTFAPIDNWRVEFLTSLKIDGAVCLEGSLEERIEAFAELLRDKKITCTIGADSTINALNWLVQMPPEIEMLRMNQEIGGERFGKMKRDSVRIFYQLNRDEHKLRFWVYEKTADSYEDRRMLK